MNFLGLKKFMEAGNGLAIPNREVKGNGLNYSLIIRLRL